MVSSTELMKQAEHCGAFSKPQLNHTGLLKAAFWCTSRCLRSSLNACSASAEAKYCWRRAHSVIVSTTRPMSCLTECSRSGEPMWPRKYFETTMLVACCDHVFGISTLRCSKTTLPRSLPMTASRSSHSTSSNGSTPAVVKYRGKSSPGIVTADGAPRARRRPGRLHLSPGCLLPGSRSRQLVPSAFLHASSASFRDETAPPSRGSRPKYLAWP